MSDGGDFTLQVSALGACFAAALRSRSYRCSSVRVARLIRPLFQRFWRMVVVVYSERPHGTHVISLRKAEKHEARYYRKAAKENLDQG